MSKVSNKYSSLDIVNSKNWDKSLWLSFFQDRLWKMEAKRSPFDSTNATKWVWIWETADTQVNAVSFYDNFWQLQVNVPLEKVLKEIYMGRTSWKLQYDIVPDGQTDIESLQPSKYALMFYLEPPHNDGSFWVENKRFRDLKSHYGSCIYFTGIRKSISFQYATKDDAEIEDDEDMLSKSNFDKIEDVQWSLYPKTIHPRDFYIDDNAYGQPDVQQAEDCIYKERLTALELELRYWKNKRFDLKGVTYSTDPTPKNKDDIWVDSREIILYHYYHKITRKLLIVANRDIIIYDGIYLNNDNRLPFENIQHYSNENRFRGEGIPERVAYLKAYKSEILQDILIWAEMSSWIHLITWNDDQIGQDWNVWGRWVNIWRNTSWPDGVKPVSMSPNLNYFASVLDILEKQITMDSGINPLEQIDPISDKVWIVEIMEANKAIRNKSVDENYNIGLDNVLTMTLSRIRQFAPALLSEKIKNKKGKTIKIIFPKIKIENFTVKQTKSKFKDKKLIKKWEIKLTEDLGKLGYFELEPKIIEWLWVKIVTPSTNSMLPILERQKINEYINNFNVLAQVAITDQTWKMMENLRKSFKFEDLVRWNNDAYQIDVNWLKANTKKDDIAEENIEKLNALKEVLTINPEWQDVWQNTWLPTPWQAPIPTEWEQQIKGWGEPLPTGL